MTTQTMTDSPRRTLATTADREYTQARIRVNQEGAQALWRLVLAEETRLLTARRQGGEPERALHQQELKNVRRIKDEIERVLEEQGWYD